MRSAVIFFMLLMVKFSQRKKRKIRNMLQTLQASLYVISFLGFLGLSGNCIFNDIASGPSSSFVVSSSTPWGKQIKISFLNINEEVIKKELQRVLKPITLSSENKQKSLIIFDVDKTLIPFDSFEENILSAQKGNLKNGVFDLFQKLKSKNNLDIAFASHNDHGSLVQDYKNILLGSSYPVQIEAFNGNSKLSHFKKLCTNNHEYALVIFIDDKEKYLSEFLKFDCLAWSNRIAIEAYKGQDQVAFVVEETIKVLNIK